MKLSFPIKEDLAKTSDGPSARRLARLAAAIAGGLLLTLLALFALQPEALLRGIANLEERWGGTQFGADRGFTEKVSVVLGSFFQSRLDGLPEVPDLVIDVPFKEISKIYSKRDEALAAGHLVQGPDDFVKGDIRLADRNIPIKLRLKGDWVDHLQGRKWSFRIRVRDGDHVLGMRRFSIQNPMTRGFQTEVMYFGLLQALGVMTPRYSFVNVSINGEPVGLMALEEFFAKELLENRRRREGVIVRFDESLVWNARDSLTNESVGWGGSFDDYRNAAVDGIGSTKIAESAELTAQFKVAQGLLRGFAAGHLTASSVFDARQLGRFIAASDALGAWHATRWTNVRFYLNPITQKLEPIAFDATLQDGLVDAASIINSEPMLMDMLRDPVVWREYLSSLQMLYVGARDGSLQQNLQSIESRWLPLLQTEFRALPEFSLEYVLPRVEALFNGMSAISSNGPPRFTHNFAYEPDLYPVLAHFEILDTANGRSLIVRNAIPRDVVFINAEWVNDTTGNRHSAVATELPVEIPPRILGAIGQQFEIPLLPLPDDSGWQLETRSGIRDRAWTVTNRPNAAEAALDAPPVPLATIASQLLEHDFLSAEPSSNTVNVSHGDWQVSSSIIIPAGNTLVVPAGTTLRFAADAMLISYGAIEMRGSDVAPISLLPANNMSWPGLVVLNAADTSVLRHVIISRTHSVAMPGWTLLGGANFYRSDVKIEHSQFLNSRGEDALNIIHSGFEIAQTLFKNTVSDAFDADFASGSIVDSRFENIGSAGGGDAIDVSGSALELDGISFANVSDKSLSIGERSEATAIRISVHGAGTGVASKDGSTLSINDSRIDSATFAAMTAYVKKPEYGPARLVAGNVAITSTKTPVIAQTNSEVVVDGVAVETEDVDVDALYETIMRPGLRE